MTTITPLEPMTTQDALRSIGAPMAIEMDWRDLYAEAQPSLLGLSAVLAWLIALDAARQGMIVTGQLVAALLLMAGPAASLAIMVRRPRLSRHVLAGAITLGYLALVCAYPLSALRYTGVLVLIACYGILSSVEHLILTAAMALGLLGIQVWHPAQAASWAATWAALGLLIGVAGCSWISRRPLLLALGWASQSISRALELNDALQRRQLQLNRTLRAMDEANERLAVMNRRLAEAREFAEEARKAKSRFAAHISHELRTPLNLIVGFTQVMYTDPEAYPGVELSPAFMVDLGAIQRNAQHLQRLVDDVLDLSAIETGHMVIQPEPTDMAVLAREAMAIVEGLVRLRGLALIADLEEVPTVYVDRTRIKQVLLNLLSNAARYTHLGSITVRLAQERDWVVCEVVDTGPGIRPEDQQRLFQEFERMTRDEGAQRSAGLGLAISKRFVQAHGGEIWVHSDLDCGSTFGFRLPITGMPQMAELPGMATVPHHRERLPVVALTQSLVAGRLLTRHMEGHRIIVVPDIDTALGQVRSLQPQALIVDAALGEEVVATLQTRLVDQAWGIVRSPHVLVLPMPSDDARRITPAVRGYLAKPILRDDLLDALRAQGEAIQQVLLVDDDEDLLRLLSHYLQDAARPYRVITARNGREALQRLTQERIDLILLDLVMPVMDGYHVLDELRRQNSKVPVIVISGQDALDPHIQLEGVLELRLTEAVGAERLVSSLDILLTALGGVTTEASVAPSDLVPATRPRP
jgi:signal transduction histidine kinase/CheY-like chemotaxis protein